jgi:hypothetical protein
MSAQSITIDGVPASVTRAQVIEALRVLGIDAAHVVSFGGIEGGNALYVEVFSDGRHSALPPFEPRRWTADGQTVATHRLTIPVLEREETPT